MKTSLRQYRALSAAVALLIGALFTALPVEAAPQWGAYHDQTGAQHQAKTNWFVDNGFRLVSLCIYGTANSQRYAAIWVKTAGPNYQTWHGLTPAGYQQKVEDAWDLGYGPTMATATDAGASSRFACVLEKDGKSVIARHGIDWYTVYSLNDQYKNTGWILTWIDCYGTASNPRYTAIWKKNTTGADWKVHSNLSSSTLQDIFDSYLEDGFRIAHIAVSPNQKYTAIWRNDIGGLRKVYWGLTSAQYQQKTEDLWDQGYRPISVQAGGSGNSTRFAAIYVKD
jgi:hypothetical protein